MGKAILLRFKIHSTCVVVNGKFSMKNLSGLRLRYINHNGFIMDSVTH